MKRTLVGYVNLRDNINYQAVYASQLYGTFFGIFAKFESTVEPIVNSRTCYTISRISLKLINYKGTIGLGFESMPYIETTGKTHITRVSVKAFSTQNEISFSLDNSIIHEKDILIIERRLIPIHGNNIPLKNGIFDSEFYVREGLPPGNQDFPVRNPGPNDIIDQRDSILYPGILCPYSENIIV